MAVDNSSAKIDFNPVPGARDYRVFDLSDPTTVKYAGLVHLIAPNGSHFLLQPDGATPVWPPATAPNTSSSGGPTSLTIPAPEIEWNLLGDHGPHTLVVQAVDQLGPVPPANLYTLTASGVVPLVPPLAPGAVLGANEGPTPDGLDSINGQGSSTNAPQAIAQSAPFVVSSDPTLAPIPSMRGASQTFLDTFDPSEAASLAKLGAQGTRATWSLNAGTPRAETITFSAPSPVNGTSVDTPLLEDGYFEDIIANGGLNENNGSMMFLSPNQTVDLTSGLLHLTMEVDLHGSAHRWVGFNVVPAGSSFPNSFGLSALLAPRAQNSGLGFTVGVTLSPGGPRLTPISAASGGSNWGPAANPLDDRQRLDLFLTTSHVALFVDGVMAGEGDIPAPGFPFTQAQVAFSHTFYGATVAHQSLLSGAPWETYLINSAPNTDERHWDNVGFEVLPASAVPSGSWSSLGALLRPVFAPLG